jgi:flagellar motor switch protein FliN/FliY
MTEEQTAPEPSQPETEAPPPAAAEGATRNLDVILDLDLPLTVRFGQTQIALGALVQIGPGSVVNLDRSPVDPVEVLVNGKVIARGEVVSVAGHYGVRITDIVSPSERIPQFGG